MEARRVHVLYGPVGVREAASFIASALLVSHGVRRDAVAAVETRHGWLVAAGWEVRHLRPDADTAEGWVRAVLRGRRGLGGRLVREPPRPPGGFTAVDAVDGPPSASGLRGAAGGGWLICYGAPCPGAEASVGLGGVPVMLGPALVNVLIDRVESGLPVC